MGIEPFWSRRLVALALAGVALLLIAGGVYFIMLKPFKAPPSAPLTQGTSSPPTMQEIASAVSHASAMSTSTMQTTAQAVQKQAAKQAKSSTSQQSLEAIQAAEAAQAGQQTN